ncbi:MAG TPA: uracil-DNA glycosylase [Clostridiaceae bacterium]|jgi:DNA polymerase|nr:uracil-DNA glycosylase [Clostridiaceae bacterium]
MGEPLGHDLLPEAWQTFCADCESCRACSLGEIRQNAVVFRGALKAPLFILGEGPGEKEDEQGKPFVGRSGQLLDLLLKAVGMPADQVHIGNIVKCRPPGNRVPSEAEAAACSPLLERQFELVSPQIVLLMGATAYRYFTGQNDAITKVRGVWQSHRGMAVLPTFHPAYVLRNNRHRLALYEDMLAVRGKIDA